MSFSVSSAKTGKPTPLVPQAVFASTSTVDCNDRQEIYISDLLGSELVRLVNIPAGTPSVALPNSSQLLTLFENPVVGSVKTLFMTNNAQVNITGSSPASQVVSHNSISLVTIRVSDTTTPVVTVQIFPVGASSVPTPIVYGLPINFGTTLSANLTHPQLSSTLTEVTLTNGFPPGPGLLSLDSAANYFAAFSGHPGMPVSYSFVVNNNSGVAVSVGNSPTVTKSYAPALLQDQAVYEFTLHFGATGAFGPTGVYSGVATAGIVRIA